MPMGVMLDLGCVTAGATAELTSPVCHASLQLGERECDNPGVGRGHHDLATARPHAA